MANVIVTFKIMPEDPQVDLAKIEEQAKQKIADYAGEGETRVSEKPVAFGLKALEIIFVTDESKGTTDDLEKEISEIEGVRSVEVIDVRRAVG